VAQLQEADLAGIIDGLDQEQSDVFMKYLYRLMSKSSNCNLVLKAHAMLAEKAGMGCVVRVLTDRKTV
jgi:actin related protein 2/3 complex subunit 5